MQAMTNHVAAGREFLPRRQQLNQLNERRSAIAMPEQYTRALILAETLKMSHAATGGIGSGDWFALFLA